VLSVRGRVKEWLNTPIGRPLLALLGSFWITFVRREPCFVRWKDGYWIHHFRSVTIPHKEVAGPLPVEQFTSGSRDIYCFEYTPQPGDVVLDVGAGAGNATLLFSRLIGPEGRVVAMEPHPDTFALLELLCRLNDLSNVDCLDVAAADVEGEVIISDFRTADQNTVLGGDQGILVQARTLDAIANEFGVDHVDFIKMNIEGGERFAIAGMAELAERTTHVAIGCHDCVADDALLEVPDLDQFRTKALVESFLREHGFQVVENQEATEPWTRDYLYGHKAIS
jgi:FkbM family methyltransferase